MEQGQNNYYRDLGNMHDECEKCISFHITVTMKDGKNFDGIIENVGSDYIDMLVGENVMEGEMENKGSMERQFHPGGPGRRFRRFRRRRFPLGALAALSLISYPYGYPAYQYYPYYPYYPYYGY